MLWQGCEEHKTVFETYIMTHWHIVSTPYMTLLLMATEVLERGPRGELHAMLTVIGDRVYTSAVVRHLFVLQRLVLQHLHRPIEMQP